MYSEAELKKEEKNKKEKGKTAGDNESKLGNYSLQFSYSVVVQYSTNEGFISTFTDPFVFICLFFFFICIS